MIFDHITNKANYTTMPLLYDLLTALENCTADTLSTIIYPNPTIPINVVTLVSKPESTCLFEAHKKYIDLHYILSGVEGIATAAPSTLAEVDAYSDEKDIGFYEGKADGTYFLTPGSFMLCFPSDAHKVAIMQDAPSPIKKLVCKIPVSYLSKTPSL